MSLQVHKVRFSFFLLLYILLNLCMSESQTLVGNIKLCVVGANEDITKDPEGTDVGWQINTHETTQTDGLTPLAHLQQEGREERKSEVIMR